jgi:hypothetical protein
MIRQPINFSRTLGLGIVEVAYGEKMLNLIGDELLSWNGESMHLYEENFVKLWFVDIFNFRTSMLLRREISCFLIYAQSASYQAGFQAPVSGAADPPILHILTRFLMHILERSASAPTG